MSSYSDHDRHGSTQRCKMGPTGPKGDAGATGPVGPEDFEELMVAPA